MRVPRTASKVAILLDRECLPRAPFLLGWATLDNPVDLDGYIQEYRECCRHVWNTYFQRMATGWHEFIDVDRAMFQGLVLSRLGRSVERGPPDSVVEAIRVLPQIPPFGHLSVFYVEPPKPPFSETVRWEEGLLTPGEVDLRLAGFFDWRNDNEPMDMRYVRVRALYSHQPEFAGKDLLLEYQHVRFALVG